MVDERTLFVHVHIVKCGGTTFYNIMRRLFQEVFYGDKTLKRASPGGDELQVAPEDFRQRCAERRSPPRPRDGAIHRAIRRMTSGRIRRFIRRM